MSNQPQKPSLFRKIAGYFVRFGDEPVTPQIQERTQAQNQVPAKVSKADTDEQPEKAATPPTRAAGNEKPAGRSTRSPAKIEDLPGHPSAIQKPAVAAIELAGRRQFVPSGEQHVIVEDLDNVVEPAAASTICINPNTRRLSLFVM